VWRNGAPRLRACASTPHRHWAASGGAEADHFDGISSSTARAQHPALGQASAAATMTSSAAIAAGARFRDDRRSRIPLGRIT